MSAQYPSLFLEGVDSDGASLMAYLTRLPGSGALSQLDGTPIASVPALVRDPYSRLQYTPERNANGDALTSFDFVVSNGFQNSTQTTVTIDVSFRLILRFLRSRWLTCLHRC